MKTELNSITLDVTATLNSYLKQLKEMRDFMEKASNSTLYDDFLEDNIEDTELHLCDAAFHISQIIGREYLNAEYYGDSSFRFKEADKKKGESE